MSLRREAAILGGAKRNMIEIGRETHPHAITA